MRSVWKALKSSHSYLALHMFKPWGPLEVKESKEVAEEEERSGAGGSGWDLPPLWGVRGKGSNSKSAILEYTTRREGTSGFLFQTTNVPFYFSSEDQNWVAPAGNFNRNSSVIILNCERAKLCDIVCTFVLQTWTTARIHLFVFKCNS